MIMTKEKNHITIEEFEKSARDKVLSEEAKLFASSRIEDKLAALVLVIEFRQGVDFKGIRIKLAKEWFEDLEKAVSFDEIDKYIKNPETKITDAKTQNAIGFIYDILVDISSINTEHKAAAEWYRKAAEQGYAYAQFNLGVCYKRGQGVAQDYAAAVKWYRKAADQGDAYAQHNLGGCYYAGQGVAQDYNEAVRLYRLAADQGYAKAQFNLGYCYAKGQGVAQDYAAAVNWYRKAAEQGNAHAQHNLGYCYENGQGVAQDYAAAAEWYRKAAEQGDADAQHNLGYFYYAGQGVAQDYAAAVKWYRLAADQGYANAQNNLGYCYKHGQGVAKDYAAAAEWYRKAADQGYDYAQSNLGGCYYAGQGVAQDYAAAAEWYRKAADQGYAHAQNNLGGCYKMGQGVAQDYAAAVKWYRLAAEQGNANAQAKLAPLQAQKEAIKNLIKKFSKYNKYKIIRAIRPYSDKKLKNMIEGIEGGVAVLNELGGDNLIDCAEQVGNHAAMAVLAYSGYNISNTRYNKVYEELSSEDKVIPDVAGLVMEFLTDTKPPKKKRQPVEKKLEAKEKEEKDNKEGLQQLPELEVDAEGVLNLYEQQFRDNQSNAREQFDVVTNVINMLYRSDMRAVDRNDRITGWFGDRDLTAVVDYIATLDDKAISSLDANAKFAIAMLHDEIICNVPGIKGVQYNYDKALGHYNAASADRHAAATERAQFLDKENRGQWASRVTGGQKGPGKEPTL